MSEQADTNAADRVTAQMRTKSFRYDFIGYFRLCFLVRLSSVDLKENLVQGKRR